MGPSGGSGGRRALRFAIRACSPRTCTPRIPPNLSYLLVLCKTSTEPPCSTSRSTSISTSSAPSTTSTAPSSRAEAAVLCHPIFCETERMARRRKENGIRGIESMRGEKERIGSDLRHDVGHLPPRSNLPLQRAHLCACACACACAYARMFVQVRGSRCFPSSKLAGHH